jgi:cobalt-precorrin-5B (C1)-methyltransferase
VGTVTKPGLPLEVGEPAINPVPLAMMRAAVAGVAAAHGAGGDVTVVDGDDLARHTWNPRLGTLGGLSILGTTGIVVRYVVVIDRAGQVVGRAGPRG